jgi:ankyrin repeat protein
MPRAVRVLSLLLALTGSARADFDTLLSAARTGDTALVLQLLASGESPDPPSSHHGYSPLQFAAEHGDVAVVTALLTAGADPEFRDHNGDRAMLWAAKEGQATTLRLLLAAGSPPDSPDDPYGRTPLMEAAASASPECVALLLAAGADPARFDQTATTALHFASARPEATRLLLAAGANPNAITEYTYWTPLHDAAAYGDPAVIRLLLAADVAREARNSDGNTALMLATLSQDPERVAALLEWGADPNLANDVGLTPLLAAARDGQVEAARLLLAAGADVAAIDRAGQGIDDHLLWHPVPHYLPEGSRAASIGLDPDPAELACLDAAHAEIRALVAKR